MSGGIYIRPVIFLDSGIGSIPYARFFRLRNKNERLVLVADSANFPYGPKSRESLTELLVSRFDEIIKLFNPKLLILACNTASISALDVLRETFPLLPIVGTVPAVKPAVLASSKRCVGVLGTQRTVEEPYVMELAARFGPECEIVKMAAPDLVEFVEHHWLQSGREERLSAVKPWIDAIIERGADALVLSCSHFLLLRDEFVSAGGDSITIFDSVEGVVKKAEALLDQDEGRLRAEPGEEKPLLIITGSEGSEGTASWAHWEQLCGHFGFDLGENLLKG